MGMCLERVSQVAAPAHVEEWTGEGTSVAEIERRLAELRGAAAADGVPQLRTSVLTHLAWVPSEWEEAAFDTLAGLAERHPSRAIILLPDPDAGRDALDARVSLVCFELPGQEHQVCSEVIELHLRGRLSTARAPASVVAPLFMADLPVFLRWRGRPPFGDASFEGLCELVDRLIVDSGEWADTPDAYAELERRFDVTAVSDIAWSRGEPWRLALARLWPGIADVERLWVRGPRADALLLHGWLSSRLARAIGLAVEDAHALDAVVADEAEVRLPPGPSATSSDHLSGELDKFSRDVLYEDAVRAATAILRAPAQRDDSRRDR